MTTVLKGYSATLGIQAIERQKAHSVRFSRQQSNKPTMTNIRRFRRAVLSNVDEETTQKKNRKEYASLKEICKTWAQCVPTAMAFMYAFGGQLQPYSVTYELDGKEQANTHYANLLNGKIYDLTSDQFNGDGLHAIDDPVHGVLNKYGRQKRDKLKPVPVKIISVTRKPSLNGFHYGASSERTKLLVSRLESAGWSLPGKP